MFKSTGRLVYDPVIKGDPDSFKEFWLIAECDTELAGYYRWLARKEMSLDWFLKPAWGAHISVTRGDKPPHPEHWRKYHGQKIEFEYSNIVWTNGRHYWLDVVCPRMSEIRVELGLPPKFAYAEFHLTIGNLDPSLFPPR